MKRYVGLVGPVIFFSTAFIVAGLLSGYSNETQMISELGATGSNYASIFNYFGFFPNGLFISLFGLYFYTQLKQHRFNALPAILIIIHGLGMVLATWFSCDITCTPQDPSIKQLGHDIIAVIKFPALQVAIIIFTVQLLKRGHSKFFAYGSIFTFLISLALMVLFISSIPTREFTGVYQRLFIASIYIWLVVLSLNLTDIMVQKPVEN